VPSKHFAGAAVRSGVHHLGLSNVVDVPCGIFVSPCVIASGTVLRNASVAIDWDAPVDFTARPGPAALSSARPDAMLSAVVSRYYSDRPAFFRDVMGADKLEVWQERELKALDAGCTRLTIRSGHGVGKTMFLAGVILHFLLTRFPCKVAVTAPSATQLFDALAAEVKIWLKRIEAKQPLFAGILSAGADRVFMNAAPEGCFCTYRTSRKESPEALQGIHADNVLLIADEASGVVETVYEAASGSMSTRGAITILAGNPTRANGFFHMTHTKLAKVWRSVKVSCFESSRVDKNYIEEERAYGEESNRFRIRVRGEFPEGSDDTLIARGLVEAAIGRAITAPRKEPIYWGLDVARSLLRDKSSLAKRKGSVCPEPIKRWQFDDVMKLVGVIKREYDGTRDESKPEAIFVDVIGVGGGVCDRLRELDLPAIGINVGESASVLMNAVRMRDELWLHSRDWFTTKAVAFPADPETVEELCTPTVAYQSNGNAKVESKDEMRARGALGGASPDGADAFNLTFARVGAITAGAMQGKSREGPLRRKNTRRV
jgi:phage terminase large subunit